MSVAPSIAVSDPANVLVWNASLVEPGCYHPYAILKDPIEGSSARLSQGLITVIDGGNVPASVWILNREFDQPTAAGTFTVRFRVDDPDDFQLQKLLGASSAPSDHYLFETSDARGVEPRKMPWITTDALDPWRTRLRALRPR